LAELFGEWKKLHEKGQQVQLTTYEDIKAYVENNNYKTTFEALPICFDNEKYWECYATRHGQGLGYCYQVYDCRLVRDQDKFQEKTLLDECFEKTVRTLYDWRRKFVHEAKLPPIREVANVGGRYKKNFIIVELTTTELKPVFEKMLKRYFKHHQKNMNRTLS